MLLTICESVVALSTLSLQLYDRARYCTEFFITVAELVDIKYYHSFAAHEEAMMELRVFNGI